MSTLLTKKIVSDVSGQLRSNGKSVVFTRGTFDLFHKAHSDFLNFSKKEGDYLIVGLEPDKNIRKLKGLSRPLIPQDHRIELILNHKAVDFAFLIDNTTIAKEKPDIELYSQIRPNKVTYGRAFPYKKQFFKKRNKIRGVRYKDLEDTFYRTFNGKEPTTSIIRRVVRLSSRKH